jgi:hypothetical protein
VKKMSCKELRAALAERGLPTVGVKGELQARLAAAMEPCPASVQKEPLSLQKRKLSVIAEESFFHPVPEVSLEEIVGMPPILSADQIRAMKVGELRAALGARGLDSSGVKAALVERLLQGAIPTPRYEAPAPAPEAVIATADNLVAPTADEVMCMTVAALKERLTAVGLTATGKKAELQARLLDFLQGPHEEAVAVDATPETGGAEPVAVAQPVVPDIHAMKVGELRAALEGLGLDTSGLKTALQERLMAHYGSLPTEEEPVLAKGDAATAEGAPAPKRARSMRRR